MPNDKNSNTYYAYSPKGVRIAGVAELVPATSFCDVILGPNGGIEHEWNGDSETYWDCAEWEKQDGETLYVDEHGDTWKESELVFKDADGNVWGPAPTYE